MKAAKDVDYSNISATISNVWTKFLVWKFEQLNFKQVNYW